jgi:hypothetical protein
MPIEDHEIVLSQFEPRNHFQGMFMRHPVCPSRLMAYHGALAPKHLSIVQVFERTGSQHCGSPINEDLDRPSTVVGCLSNDTYSQPVVSGAHVDDCR